MTICKHCGLESDRGDFCCFGCQTANALIKSANLEAFYEKSKFEQTPKFLDKLDSYLVFDHPDFLTHHSQVMGENRFGEFNISGLHCASCIWLVEQAPRFHPFWMRSEVDYGKNHVRLWWKDGADHLSKIAITLASLGYELSPLSKKTLPPIKDWIRLGITGASAAATMHLGLYFLGAWDQSMNVSDARALGFSSALVSAPAVFYGGYPFFKSCKEAIRFKKIHADILISTALITGFIFSLFQSFKGSIEVYYDSLSMVVFFLLCGRYVIKKFSEVVNPQVNWSVLKDGKSVPVESIQVQDMVTIPSSQVVPFDGTVESPSAHLDLSVVTGESRPVLVLKGESVVQGATNSGEDFLLKVSSTFERSWLFQLKQRLSLIGQQAQPSSLAEVIFVISIFILSLAVMLSGDIAKAVGILVVACPCALMLSEPLALHAFRLRALEKGIHLLKTDRWRGLVSFKSVVFDKTGTLTKGVLKVVNIEICDRPLFEQFKNDFFSLAKMSQHPVSRALSRELNGMDVPLQDFQENKGSGTYAKIGTNVLEWKKSHNVSAKQMTVDAILNGQRVATFYCDDELRSESSEVLSLLKQEHKMIRLLTGDHESSARNILKQLPIDEWNFQQSPEAKSLAVNSHDLMIGDGLNDALAMKKSGFSIGFSGSAESSFQSADAYLVVKDLRLILSLIHAGKKLKKTIQLNLIISILYNILTIGAVMAGYIGPVLCAIFMPLSSLTVTTIAYGTQYFKNGVRPQA